MCSIPQGPLQPSSRTARMKEGTSNSPVPQIEAVVEGVGKAGAVRLGEAVVQLDSHQVLLPNETGEGLVRGAAALGVPDVEDETTVRVRDVGHEA